jgi:hypothetical protein
LSFTDGHSNGPQHPTSQGLNLYDPYGEDLLDLASFAKSPTMPGLTIVKDGSAFKFKLHGRHKKSTDQDLRLQSQPLTEEALDRMVPVREKHGILGAVALPMAMAGPPWGCSIEPRSNTCTPNCSRTVKQLGNSSRWSRNSHRTL